MSKTRRVYGWLKLADGSEIDMQGETVLQVKAKIAGRGILTFRHPDLGSESNVAVTNPSIILARLADVRELFNV